MDFAILWLPLIGVGIFGAIAIAAWFSDQKITGVWFGFAGCVCLLILGALQIQHSLQEEKPQPLSPEAAAARVIVAAQSAMQRAWVSIRPQLPSSITKDPPLTIELVAENVGKEPATGVNHHGMTMMFDAPVDLNYAPDVWSADLAQIIRLECDLAQPMSGRMTIFPGNTPTLQVQWKTAQDIADLMAGKKMLVMYGCVGYFAEGSPHYTWYCFFLIRDRRGNWMLGSAPIGNDAN